MRNVLFAAEAVEDLHHWALHDKKKLAKIVRLVEQCAKTPDSGIGKPEKLKHQAGLWSRRIDLEHRLVYQFDADTVTVLMCRYHYGDL